MGNCLIVLEKAVRILKTDMKFLECKSSIKVNQVSSEFSQNAISDEVSDVKYLDPEDELRLLPAVSPLPVKKIKKKVQFADDGLEDSRVVRIKLVLTRQKLQEMLGKGGISVDHMITEVQKEEDTYGFESNERGDAAVPKGWSPALESIPEVN